jgi:hypothetical protein
MRLLVALIAWAAAVAGAAGVAGAVAGSIHNSPDSGAVSRAGTSYDASNVKLTDADSFFRAANLAKALAVAKAKLGADAEIDNAVIYPGYVDLTAVQGGNEVDLYINSRGGGELTHSPGANTAEGVFALSRMTADVPQALAQRIATAANTPESELHYVVITATRPPKPLEWAIYTVEGNPVTYFQAPSGAAGPLFELAANSSTGLTRVRG